MVAIKQPGDIAQDAKGEPILDRIIRDLYGKSLGKSIRSSNMYTGVMITKYIRPVAIQTESSVVTTKKKPSTY